MNVDVLVIGGGPGGLLSSIQASKGRNVTLLEKPSRTMGLGKRILVSGNGRANFFNEDLFHHQDRYDFLLRDSDHDYARDFFSYLEGEGFSYTKEDSLYYPYFKRSECLHSFLMDRMKKVKVIYGTALMVRPEEKTVLVLLEGKKIIIHYEVLVLSIGGRSYDREDYSYDLLSSLKVRYHAYQSMLCPIRTKEKIPSYLSKQRLRMKLSLFAGQDEIFSEVGEVLFKDDGISGIAVFNSTKYLLDHKRMNPGADFLYQIDYAYDGLGKHTSLSCYPSFLKKYLEENHFEKGEPLLFHFDSLYPFKESQASYGGILLDEVDEERLCLKKYPDIYAIGEMLDVNMKCGGYNMGMSLVEGFEVGRRLARHGSK